MQKKNETNDQAHVVTTGEADDRRTAPADLPTSVDAVMSRLRAVIDAVDAMEHDNERRVTLYYVVARTWGNEYGDAVLEALRSATSSLDYARRISFVTRAEGRQP